jgi:hypothetical protein
LTPIAAPASAVDGDDRTPLLPVRHPNQDLFICDVLDAIPKDDMASMEHPVFSLSTKPDNRMRRYEHNGNVMRSSLGQGPGDDPRQGYSDLLHFAARREDEPGRAA